MQHAGGPASDTQHHSSTNYRGWRDDTVANTCYQRTQVQFPPPTGDSQPSLTPIPKDPIPSSRLHGSHACIWYIDMHTDKTFIRIRSKTTPPKIIIIVERLSVSQYVVFRINKATLSMPAWKDCLDICLRKKRCRPLIMTLHTQANNDLVGQ